MKILIVHTVYRYKGGEETIVESEKTLLQHNENEVLSLIFENPSNPIKALLLFFVGLFNLSSYFKMGKIIKKFRPDIIHVHNWHFAASPAIFWAAYTKKVPIVHSIHNYRLLCPSGTLFHHGKLFLDSLQQNFPWKAIRGKVYRNSTFQTFWMAFIIWFHYKIKTWDKIDSYIAALTPFGTNLFISNKSISFSQKIAIKPNFIYADQFPHIKRRSDFFLFIGRLSEEKGIDCLLGALKSTELELKIGGNGPLVVTIREICEKHHNIQYLGNLSQEQVWQYMRECSALIFTSIWYEGMPRTIIEAFSQGLPVIASNLGAMSSMITDGYNGLLFEAGNSVDLQTKLIEWQNKSQDEKELFSKNAYQTYLDNYTPEQNLAQLMAIYNSVTRRK
jgi:glycosyltransferase involved in cell wall biosynthesis